MREVVPHLVSTIIPVYNRPDMVREAVGSVLAQTHRPIEVIVADDGSTDDTPRVIESLVQQHPEVVFLRHPNSGPGPTREAGRRAARGEFIQYLDSDDLLRPRKFEMQIAALRANPDCGAAYGYICVHRLGKGPSRMPFKGSGDHEATLFPRILYDRWWNTDCPLFRRSVCDAAGPWSDLKWSQDWEYDGRIGALGIKLAFCPEWVCDERHHTNQRQTTPANWMEPLRLRERLRFLTMMFAHAERAGVRDDAPEREHFTRWVFAVARQCAAAGLAHEARSCLELAERSAGTNRRARRGVGTFRLTARLVGWQPSGKASMLAARLKRPSSMTLPQAFARPID